MAKDSHQMSTSTAAAQVGSIVRARLPDHPKATRRALVATVQDENTVCILWEDEAPRPRLSTKAERGSFLVTPLLKDSAEEIESTVATADLIELLPFETETDGSSDADTNTLDTYQRIGALKERGDQLLRLGDASAAVTYYENALSLSSVVQIGSSIILKVGGHALLAEVDCIEDESMDVEITETGEERTIPRSQALLSILEPGHDSVQERILLNLARCLLQLAETTTLQLKRRPLYLRGAILACTLVISVSSFHSQDSVSSTHMSALLLRSQAQASLSKYPHAKADLKQLLSLDPGHREGLKRLRELEKQQLQIQKTDRKLVKEVCQWVQTAANDPVSRPSENQNQDRTTDNDTKRLIPPPKLETNSPALPFSSWFYIGLILLAAIIYQKVFSSP